MKITLVSSCGLVLEQDGQTLLIDALNKQYRCYYGLPPETFVRMLSGEPPYDAVCGILFTHAHPDHYSASRTEQLRAGLWCDGSSSAAGHAGAAERAAWPVCS